jgi:SPP1 family predicted phage head-tail adaptor
MRAGQLRDKISVIAPASTTRSADGAPVVSYSTILSSVWARVEPLGGRESYRSDYRWADSDLRVTIRYTTVAIEPRYALVFSGSTYDIQGIINTDNRNPQLVFLARKSKGVGGAEYGGF